MTRPYFFLKLPDLDSTCMFAFCSDTTLMNMAMVTNKSNLFSISNILLPKNLFVSVWFSVLILNARCTWKQIAFATRFNTSNTNVCVNLPRDHTNKQKCLTEEFPDFVVDGELHYAKNNSCVEDYDRRKNGPITPCCELHRTQRQLSSPQSF